MGLPKAAQDGRELRQTTCRIGSDALELAERQQVSNVQDVRRLRLDLQPWHDARAVRELDEQLAGVLWPN